MAEAVTLFFVAFPPPSSTPLPALYCDSGKAPLNRAQANRGGNIYPVLTQQQLDEMRMRRLTSNCAPQQLQQKQPAAHQAKHIMMCR